MPAFLAHPGNDGFVDIEGHALFEPPAQQGQGIVRAARQIIERQNENAHARVGNQKSHWRAGGWDVVEDAAQSRAHTVGLRDVGFHGRSHYRPDGSDSTDDFLQMAANLSPSRRGNMLAGNFDGDAGMRHLVQPGVNAANQTDLIELLFQTFAAAEISQGKSPY